MEKIGVFLAVLACPVGMGAMMWFMAKSAKGAGSKEPKPEAPQTSIEELRAEQERIGAQIDRLDPDSVTDGRRVVSG